MDKKTLALFGGEKEVKTPLKKYNSIGDEELAAAIEVIKGGVLSKFIGGFEDDFFGGDNVQLFERRAAEYFGVKHAVTVNSWTSGLICALGAIGIEPGDEVIVTPWTMCATATAILHWNAIPVFADIDQETFNLDPLSVENCITPYTKAVMAADIFGQSCDIERLKGLAERYNLKLITDSAQSPGARFGDEFVGVQADIGGFSLNYHKHIHTGEGGILVTNDDNLATRLKLIRNHGEAVVGGMGLENISNIVGHNFRLGEIEAAIGIQQLGKLSKIVSTRQSIGARLSAELEKLRGVNIPKTKPGNSHAYYILPIIIDPELLGVRRETLVTALVAEGLDGVINGYANIHLLPMYQKKVAYGKKGFPWSSDICKRDVDYSKGICPVAEKLHDISFMGFEMCLYELGEDDLNRVVRVFKKVWDNLEGLQKYESKA